MKAESKTTRTPSTGILGREHETQAIQNMLEGGTRLITLRGPGGIGKTALAKHLARALQGEYQHILFVDLSALHDPQQVLATIAAHLPQPQEHASPLKAITQFAANTSLLLILDNFEQLLNAASDIAELLQATDALQIIITSRAILSLHDEHEYSLDVLSLPDTRRRPGESAAVQLFVQRARVTQPAFELSEGNSEDVARIVEALEGVPLAIELAASRLRTYALHDLLTRLARPLNVLKADFRDRPERLRSLRAAVQWSYDLLSEEYREVFECCAVFEGSFTPEALVQVWGSEDVLDPAEVLLEQSFLQRLDGPATRWKMLQPLRELALEKLPEQPNAQVWQERHARYYLTVTQEMQQHRLGPPSDVRERYLPDYPNMRAGLIWAIEQQQADVALRYLHGIILIWDPFGLQGEGHQLTQRVLALPAAGLEHLRPRALLTATQCLLTLDHPPEALAACARELQAVSREQGHTYEELHGHMALAAAEHWAGRSAESIRINRELIERCEQLLAMEAEQRPGAITDAPIRRISTQAVNNMVFSLLQLGQYELALEHAIKAREQYRQLGLYDSETRNHMIGHAQYHLGQLEAAATSYLASLNFSLEGGYLVHARNAVRGFGMVVAAQGDAALAVQFVAFADRLSLPHTSPYIEAQQHEVLLQLRERLGEAAYQQAWREGEQLTPEEVRRTAQAFVQAFRPPGSSAVPDRPQPAVSSHPLTARELEVLALVTQGHPDRRIAKLLNISPGTASRHVANMLSKLGLRNRVELARWAIERGVCT